MKVVLTRNLGSELARSLGWVKGDWKPEEFLSGTTIDVDGKPLEELLKRGLVEETAKIRAEAKHPPVKGH